ncbi:EEF1A lysine methyltransferase 1, partial [Geodia barretti]
MAALQEFYTEQEERQRRFEAGAIEGAGAGGVAIEEDWKLSQFWYDDKTAVTLAKEALDGGSRRIACISCPTLYAKLLQLKPADCEIFLLEYDTRFAVYGDSFVFYDYTSPLELPETMEEKSFDVVVADPPYLSEECLQKTAQTINFLAKEKNHFVYRWWVITEIRVCGSFQRL